MSARNYKNITSNKQFVLLDRVIGCWIDEPPKRINHSNFDLTHFLNRINRALPSEPLTNKPNHLLFISTRRPSSGVHCRLRSSGNIKTVYNYEVVTCTTQHRARLTEQNSDRPLTATFTSNIRRARHALRYAIQDWKLKFQCSTFLLWPPSVRV